jgi:CMP-N-acetylneuraminic acid synthetase
MIWQLIEKPIRQQVESFVELSMAIHSLASEKQNADLAFTTDPARAMRLGTQVTESLRDISDDSMRQFLLAAVQYLTQVPEDMSQIPVDVIRALRDVERIVKIEEQALEKKEQNLLRFYLLQIARIAGENG